MPKIAFLGAGSTVFAENLLGDILSFPELAGAEISLMDIDRERLRISEIVAHKVAEFFGARPAIEATLDRRRALDGADYAISMFHYQGEVMPVALVDELYSLLRKVRGVPVDVVRSYISVLRNREKSLSPAERFALKRIEGLEHIVLL